MIELFPSLLTLDQVEQLHASAAAAHWFEGAATARGDAKKIKQCQTAELPTDSTLAGIVRSIVNAPELRPFCPRRMTSPRLMRYSVADFYGPHADFHFGPADGHAPGLLANRHAAAGGARRRARD